MDVDVIKTVVLAVIGVYEVIARLVPSVNDWTVLGNAIKFLRVVSDWLNNLKKRKVGNILNP